VRCWLLPLLKKLNVFEVFEVYSHTCFNEVVNCTYDIAIWWVIWWKAEGVECAPIDDPVKHPSYTDNIAASYTHDVITAAVYSRYNITAANTASHYIYNLYTKCIITTWLLLLLYSPTAFVILVGQHHIDAIKIPVFGCMQTDIYDWV